MSPYLLRTGQRVKAIQRLARNGTGPDLLTEYWVEIERNHPELAVVRGRVLSIFSFPEGAPHAGREEPVGRHEGSRVFLYRSLVQMASGELIEHGVPGASSRSRRQPSVESQSAAI